VTRFAEAVRHAEMQINCLGIRRWLQRCTHEPTSSIRLSLTDPAPLCTMKTSLPRTDSSIETRVSPTANLASWSQLDMLFALLGDSLTSRFAGGIPRWSQICSVAS
jgi:hypothetical protein